VLQFSPMPISQHSIIPIPRSDFGFVNVAPAPVLSGLEGLDDRMVGCVKMFSGVAIGRGIATADVPAGETETQMDPRRTDHQAFLATIGVRSDRTYHRNMRVEHTTSGFFKVSSRRVKGALVRVCRSKLSRIPSPGTQTKGKHDQQHA
jgi:hypothetical protein